MDKRTLRQYRPLLKEIELLSKKLDKLQERAYNVPEVLGKVTGSSKDFPYIEEHITVQMDEPKESDEISRLMRINEKRLDKAEADRLEIEQFIAAIPNSTDRQIFELSFLQGKKQIEVANVVGYSRGRVSQIISKYVKD
ncbi:sigma-70 family RNA polymerase sigma factor [[Clostridium] scindens]|uniref:sigma factor-like helix-turn-helix DNA-binding protein n=1 Tax=Clostridium scindens (strain JCM 10418 / VPI 12708) TaxID=29347 RepID=UPI0020980323|nr:sigma factor-like helix-turn-helix DNA-binding protein [[Clostridium] scindens]MCO7171563.1 sigma-70 family RNA polymerase sigma factor [[Clostridium] scindens]